MRLTEVMSTPAASVGPNDSIESAARRMQLDRIAHLVVLDRGAVVGVVSERDLVRRAGGRVKDCMSPSVVTATPHTSIHDAANLLRGNGIGCLPVLEEGRLVGMVTVSDLLELLGRGAVRPNPRGERRVLSRRGPRKAPSRSGAR